LPDYKDKKAQVVRLVAEYIELTKLRMNCPHFNDRISTLENIYLN